MKVVSVLHFPEFGGPHNQSLRLVKPLSLRNVDSVTVLPPGPGAERLRMSGAQVHAIPLGRLRATMKIRDHVTTSARFPLDLFKLYRLFRHMRPDIVQLNGLINPHAALVANALDIPIVWQLLDTRPPHSVLKMAMVPVKALADVIMPIGKAVELAHPGAAQFGDRSVIFYPPVDTAIFVRSEPSTLRSELGVADGDPIIGVVGNINPQKGHEYLFEAFGMLRAHVPNARLVLAGYLYPQHRLYADSLRDIARRFGLVEQRDYFFLGSRNDVPNVLAGFDLFAFSPVPRSEGTSTAVLEALSMGVPVVTTTVASLPEVIVPNVTGLLVEPENSHALAVAISSLLNNHMDRKKMGIAAAADVRTRFSMDRCVAAHIEAYEKAMTHRALRHGRR